MQNETIKWNGINYRRYPNSLRRTERLYFQRSKYKKFGGKTGFLHREIWESVNGKIQKGYQIHHKDGNTLNNEIYNLMLVTPKEHYAIDPSHIKWDYKSHLDKIRPLTKAWHSSKNGLKHHRFIGSQSYKNRILLKKKCIVCGKDYTTYIGKSKYCHQNCKATALRRRRGVQPRN